jgi:anti-sigma regulatory factor (Ser/Thr protein kinase)
MARGGREQILRYLQRREVATGAELAELLGVTRQAVNRHLRLLIIEGKLYKTGSTRAAAYVLSSSPEVPAPARQMQKTYLLQGLAEDQVFGDLARMLDLDDNVSARARTILRYAFTELLNNAIEHSGSRTCSIHAVIGPYECTFEVRDFGIGIFESIRSKFDLRDESAALLELLKGKVTTMKERHSGEGIFFVSKVGDRLRIRSHRTVITIDNHEHDTVVEEARSLKGTEVSFRIRRQSRRDLTAVFQEYAPEEFDLQFQRTRVLVGLHLQEYVSRSEARRLLTGLEKFREVVLDFRRVKTIGQGFADEIFRVFPAQHPDTLVLLENAPPAVAAMVRHVKGLARPG